ncbi:hypothetical protein RD055328_10370 [Companilactobacillus sp. RD055328]|uniref:hypothetical protein n=1 Tax=Companilactobacillus sp. RD055328 TaxID=2916634 RepID=UPI001FC85073|nr:hypothetical protein [Companilactobacillus sp. RD055328]GKQ43114.1 hypothetical protein RD055328_10370 [Companilactobacillus sp. RD055328]
MRVLDLLEMLRDISKNETVWGYLDHKIYALVNIEVFNDQLFIVLGEKNNSLKNWELLFMLNKKERFNLPIFMKLDKKNHQVFGLRLDDKRIILH